jgi:hypothetical protein
VFTIGGEVDEEGKVRRQPREGSPGIIPDFCPPGMEVGAAAGRGKCGAAGSVHFSSIPL